MNLLAVALVRRRRPRDPERRRRVRPGAAPLPRIRWYS